MFLIVPLKNVKRTGLEPVTLGCARFYQLNYRLVEPQRRYAEVFNYMLDFMEQMIVAQDPVTAHFGGSDLLANNQ